MEVHKRGLSQVCVSSPDLFSLYSESVLREIEESKGNLVRGKNITYIRFVDGTVFLATSEEDLQDMLNTAVDRSERKGITINCKKTLDAVFRKGRVKSQCKL